MNMSGREDQRHKESIARYFSGDTEYWRDVYARETDPKQSFLSAEMLDRKKAVLRFLDDHADNRILRVLDIGCGTGVFMKEVVDRGHTVVGLDITDEMLKQAKDLLKEYVPKQAAFVHGDIENMDFEDGSFDVILCIGVLQYLQDDKKAVSEINRVLKSGGLAIISFPNILRMNNMLDPYYYLVRGRQFVHSKIRSNHAVSPAEFGSNESLINRRYFFRNLRGLLDHVFNRVGLEGIAYGPLTFWRKEILPTAVSLRINRFISSLSRKQGFYWLNILANRWVICLKKRVAGGIRE